MFDTLSSQILDNIVLQINKVENREKVQRHVIDPIIRYVMQRIFPYLVGCAVVLILVILLTATTAFLLIYDMKCRKIVKAMT